MLLKAEGERHFAYLASVLPSWLQDLNSLYAGIVILSSVTAFDRTPVSGRVCNGGNRSRWNMSGDSSE